MFVCVFVRLFVFNVTFWPKSRTHCTPPIPNCFRWGGICQLSLYLYPCLRMRAIYVSTHTQYACISVYMFSLCIPSTQFSINLLTNVRKFIKLSMDRHLMNDDSPQVENKQTFILFRKQRLSCPTDSGHPLNIKHINLISLQFDRLNGLNWFKMTIHICIYIGE